MSDAGFAPFGPSDLARAMSPVHADCAKLRARQTNLQRRRRARDLPPIAFERHGALA
jgi:hypothetical protein